MRRIYSIAKLPQPILSAGWVCRARFLSGFPAGANNSPGSSGINIEADSPSSSSGRCSAKRQFLPAAAGKVKDAGIADAAGKD